MSNIKQALVKAIEVLSAQLDADTPYNEYCDPPIEGAIEQCKSALAELEKCEPVATLNSSFGSDTGWEYLVRLNHNLETDEYLESIHGHDIPLFTAPQPREWIGLSDSDMFSVQYDLQYSANGFTPLEYARAIEAKLRELNEVKV